ncbi:hypothetical protein R5R35_000831 [Gryllus longicercus]|uniref:Cilia- and flagella-associated protein 300 n=1 Tax=Gryllus longicercus TaxID=2509291 RepID=A0AAN9V326_9ORTH
MEGSKYTFVYVENKTYSFFLDKIIKEYLAKWSLKGTLKINTFAFNEPFQSYKMKEFVYAFFSDPSVVNTLLSGKDADGESCGDIDYEQLLCSVTSMRFFDRLKDPNNGITMSDGYIRKCLDTKIDDFFVSDKLRKMLLDDDSEEYNLYSEDERKQFLFKLFAHLCLGGQWCQYEDNINPYLHATRAVYKDLVSVQKEAETEMIFVSSVVLKVEVKDPNGMPIFPPNPDNVQNFVYLIINPLSRRVIVLNNTYDGAFCL